MADDARQSRRIAYQLAPQIGPFFNSAGKRIQYRSFRLFKVARTLILSIPVGIAIALYRGRQQARGIRVKRSHLQNGLKNLTLGPMETNEALATTPPTTPAAAINALIKQSESNSALLANMGPIMIAFPPLSVENSHLEFAATHGS